MTDEVKTGSPARKLPQYIAALSGKSSEETGCRRNSRPTQYDTYIIYLVHKLHIYKCTTCVAQI